MADIVNMQDSDYNEILRQAVAVIDRSRLIVANSVCAAIGTAHWEIGRLLYDRKVDSKHGSGVVSASVTAPFRGRKRINLHTDIMTISSGLAISLHEISGQRLRTLP